MVYSRDSGIFSKKRKEEKKLYSTWHNVLCFPVLNQTISTKSESSICFAKFAYVMIKVYDYKVQWRQQKNIIFLKKRSVHKIIIKYFYYCSML